MATPADADSALTIGAVTGSGLQETLVPLAPLQTTE